MSKPERSRVRASELERVRKTYVALGSLRKTAKALDTSYGTIRRALIDSGGVPKVSHPRVWRDKDSREKSYGRIASWLASHGDRKIPRDYHALSLASGASIDGIKCYFYRRRKAIRERLRLLPDLRDPRIALTDDRGRLTRGDQIARYEYHVDRFSLEVGIVATTTGGESIFLPVVPPMKLREFRAQVKAALSGATPAPAPQKSS